MLSSWTAVAVADHVHAPDFVFLTALQHKIVIFAVVPEFAFVEAAEFQYRASVPTAQRACFVAAQDVVAVVLLVS